MFTRKELYVPFSGRRYIITNGGRILDSKRNEIPVEITDESIFVEIDWLLGRRKYLLSILVMFTYGSLKVPDYLIDQVEPLYVDNDFRNLTPQNLIYRFKTPLEVEDYPGFFYIPFYVNYAINKTGSLINIETGKEKQWSITPTENNKRNQKGGYFYSRVLNDFGFSKCLFLHRALCLVFKEYDNKVQSLVVNHRDGNPSNNLLDNIEWSTYKDNNIHAVVSGLKSDNKPILSKNIKTGEILRFYSINECGRYYNAPRAGFIQHRLKRSGNKIYSDYLLFKYDDGTDWPAIDLDKVEIIRSGRSDLIKARNVFTGDVILFLGAEKGSHLTGVKKATILNHVKRGHLIPCKGWNFKWDNDDTPWPNHTHRHLKIYEKFPIFPPTGAIIFDTELNVELFFESVALACNFLSITKHVFSNYAKSKTLLKKRYSLTYFHLVKSLGHPTE